ncbi:MAG: A/G-specific adenine glycosylase [Burkholderiales bacterium]
MRTFSARLVAWQKQHGRHDLPWQRTRDAYAIWLSEIMLQQTQVTTVIPYYERFLRRFPSVESLAKAPLDDVLALWSGLGYYSRARNLHKAARVLVETHGGRMPDDPEAVEALPGIGRSTAAAICVFAYGGRHAILDGNVKRVLARHGGVRGYPGDARVQEKLWRNAESLLPARNIVSYTQGLMDLGAGVCARSHPQCERCPVCADCVAYRKNLIDELPGRKPRRAIPQRNTVMLLLRRGNDILLEKRAPRGIWGGLWSLPEMEHARALSDVRRVCRERYGISVISTKQLPLVAHGFTHFKLTINPMVVQVKKAATKAPVPATLWLPLEDAVSAALPAPVRKMILTYCF